jgi:hypothetical protein
MATEPNISLQDVLIDLSHCHDDLWNRFNDSDDGSERVALHQEMQEVFHRMQIAQNLLFRAQTAALARQADAIRGATQALRTQIKSLKKVSQVITKISKYLGLVDTLLDAAKMLPGI